MKFSGTTLQKFNRAFATEEDCRKYLFTLKWKNGYRCRKCGHRQSYKGETKFHQRCRLCDYDESATANTVFHKIKFPLLKAFGIAFYVMARKKGISTMEISRCFGIRQTTAWLFKRKLQEAVNTRDNVVESLNTYAIEIQIGGSEIELNSQFRGSEKTASVFFTRKGKKILNGNARVLIDSTASHQKNYPDKKFRLVPQKKSANSFNRMYGPHVVILNLKNWLRGIHHHCSGHFVSGYLDEFFFRFNNRNHLKSIWHLTMEKMISGRPYFYKSMAAK